MYIELGEVTFCECSEALWQEMMLKELQSKDMSGEAFFRIIRGIE